MLSRPIRLFEVKTNSCKSFLDLLFDLESVVVEPSLLQLLLSLLQKQLGDASEHSDKLENRSDKDQE